MSKENVLTIGLTARGGWELNREAVIKVVAEQLNLKGFESFSVQDGVGYWKGVAEKTLIVSLVATFGIGADMRDVAAILARLLDQECILYTVREVDACFVYPSGNVERL